MKPTWAEMRQAISWSKGNYRHIGDYSSVRLGAMTYLDSLYIHKLEAEIERLKKENSALRANTSKSVLRRLKAQGALGGER